MRLDSEKTIAGAIHPLACVMASLVQIPRLSGLESPCSLFRGYMLTTSVIRILELYYTTINRDVIKQLHNDPFLR